MVSIQHYRGSALALPYGELEDLQSQPAVGTSFRIHLAVRPHMYLEA